MAAPKGNQSFRSLGGLERTASTSRVLNLAAVASHYANDPEFQKNPFFLASALNAAVIIKHRLRTDEQYMFDDARRIATKVIIPFERTDLSLGGRSLFVGQRGWEDQLAGLCGNPDGNPRDESLLEALDELPSLDPFLLREHLKRREFKIAPCYLAISRADLDRMQRFVAGEVAKLVDLAYGGKGGSSENISRLVALLLSGEDDAKLEPLRLTLALEAHNFKEGVFSWKGFLYYKWVLNSLWPELKLVIQELAKVKIVGPRDTELLRQIKDMGSQVNQAVVSQVKQVRKTLQVYDEAFDQMTLAGNPMAFRDFLLKSPEMFITLGERTGMVSHIASFWRYRFPIGRPLEAEMEEMFDMLKDFQQGLGEDDERKDRLERPRLVNQQEIEARTAPPLSQAI